jgi:hypothetical protein
VAILDNEGQNQGQSDDDSWFSYPTRSEVIQSWGMTVSEYDDCNDGHSD